MSEISKSIKFKRSITAMLAVCLTIMLLCGNFILYSYADDDEYPIGGGVPMYYPVTSCQAYESNSEHSYIYLCTDTLSYSASWGQDRHNIETWFFYVLPDAEYTNDNGIITISRDYLRLYRYSFQYHYDMEAGHIISDQGPTFLWSEDFSGDLTFSDDCTQFSFGDYTFSSGQINYAQYEFDGISYDPNALNVSVEFTPPFTGSINRESETNGVKLLMQDFKFTVTNRSRQPIQYVMFISEPGYTPSSFNTPGNVTGSALTLNFDDRLKFLYISEEDVYLNQGNAFRSLVMSCWHFVRLNSSDSVTLHWDMLDLAANHQYDVAVYAMFGVCDDVSTISAPNGNFVLPDDSSKSIHEVDFSTVQQVYRSTFSVVNPAEYNPNSTSGSAIANNHSTDYRGLMQQIKGYYGSDGKFHTTNYNTADGIVTLTPDGFRPASPSSNPYSGSHKYDSGTSYDTFLSNLSNSFGFISAVLGFFPSDVFVVLNLSLWAKSI